MGKNNKFLCKVNEMGRIIEIWEKKPQSELTPRRNEEKKVRINAYDVSSADKSEKFSFQVQLKKKHVSYKGLFKIKKSHFQTWLWKFKNLRFGRLGVVVLG